MLGWIPERVYALVKDDKKYQEWVAALHGCIRSDDIVGRILDEEKARVGLGPKLPIEREAIVRLCPPELVREYDYTYMNAAEPLIAALETETDQENRLYICQMLAGAIYRPTKPEGLKYVNQYIEEYEAAKKKNFSEKIHEEYFTFKCQLHLNDKFFCKMPRLRIGDMNAFAKWMDELAAPITKRFGESEYITKLIAHCKVRQVFYFLAHAIEVLGPRRDIGYIIKTEVLPSLEAIEFEYADFNHYKMQIYDMICKYYFDLRDPLFHEWLKKCTELIDLSFTDKEKSCKALNYYNDILGIHYLTLVTKYRQLTEVYMPWCDHNVNTDLMSDLEKRFTDTFESASQILTEEYGIDLHNNMTTELCDREMGYIKSYLEHNKENFEIFQYLG